MNARVIALVVAGLGIGAADNVQAMSIESAAGCLDANPDEGAGANGGGRNAVTQLSCRGWIGNAWFYGEGLIGVEFDGGGACLDVDFGEPIGRGYNVILWPDCHGGSNQTWLWEDDDLWVEVNGTAYCLAADRNEAIGDGFNVIVLPCEATQDTWSQR